MAKISLKTDKVVVVAWTPMLTLHDNVFPMPPMPLPHVEVPTTVYWAPGAAAGQNKMTTTVHSEGKTIALQSHDVGMYATHVGINLMLPLVLVQASRKFCFSASTVKMNGTSTGVSSFWAPTPMTVCQKYEPAFALPVTNVRNTVNVGVTAGDLISGALSIGLSMIASIVADATSANLSTAAGIFAANVINGTATAVAGAAQIAMTGEGTIGGSIGIPPAAATVGFTRSSDGSWSFGVDGAGYGWKTTSDGSSQTTKPVDGDSGRSETTKTNADGSKQKTVSDPGAGTQTTTTAPPPGHAAVAPKTPRV